MAASTIDAALGTLGAVTPATRAKAEAVWLACHLALGRAPGVLWGKDSNPANWEHYSGRALDFMTTHHGWGNDTAVGDWIAAHLIDNAAEYGVSWLIWRQRIYPASGTLLGGHDPQWRLMEDRGSTTENHLDHVHVYFGRDTLAPALKPVTQEDDMQPITYTDRAGVQQTAPAEQVLGWIIGNQHNLLDQVGELRQDVDAIKAEAQWLPPNFAGVMTRLSELADRLEVRQ